MILQTYLVVLCQVRCVGWLVGVSVYLSVFRTNKKRQAEFYNLARLHLTAPIDCWLNSIPFVGTILINELKNEDNLNIKDTHNS